MVSAIQPVVRFDSGTVKLQDSIDDGDNSDSYRSSISGVLKPQSSFSGIKLK